MIRALELRADQPGSLRARGTPTRRLQRSRASRQGLPYPGPEER